MSWVSITEAFEVELNRKPFIYALKPIACEICHVVGETRCGVCFECRELIEIDLKAGVVREKIRPTHIWPYVYHSGEPDLD